MFLGGCVGCIPSSAGLGYWTNSQCAADLYLKKPHSFHIAELLHPASFAAAPILAHGPDGLGGSGLAPLQALCAAGALSVVSGEQTATSERSRAPAHAPSTQLKFGINRILSEDFGRYKHDKENKSVTSVSDYQMCSRSMCSCENSSPATISVYSSMHYPGHALSAVHSIQPPHYPIGHGSDALPGPYSILNSEHNSVNQQKRKRSWSRAVFSNLQRKGLEKRFEVQKYVTKPDRRQLAAMLGLTDAQVKVWFQNRRMKWRHSQQQKDQKSDEEKGKKENGAATIGEDDAEEAADDKDDPQTTDETLNPE